MRLTVRDAGVGLTARSMDKLFDAFLHDEERRHGHRVVSSAARSSRDIKVVCGRSRTRGRAPRSRSRSLAALRVVRSATDTKVS